MRLDTPVDTRLYRTALRLFPPAFRQEFAHEMAQDFEESREEARCGKPRGLWRFRLHMGGDLARSMVWQWLRSGWPALVIASMAGPLIAASVLAGLLRRSRFTLAPDAPDADLMAIELIAVVSLLVIAMTILLTARFIHTAFRRSRRT